MMIRDILPASQILENTWKEFIATTQKMAALYQQIL
jgi:hypothetical protein